MHTIFMLSLFPLFHRYCDKFPRLKIQESGPKITPAVPIYFQTCINTDNNRQRMHAQPLPISLGSINSRIKVLNINSIPYITAAKYFPRNKSIISHGIKTSPVPIKGSASLIPISTPARNGIRISGKEQTCYTYTTD